MNLPVWSAMPGLRNISTKAAPKGMAKNSRYGRRRPQRRFGPVGEVPDERVDDRVPDLAHQQGGARQRRAQAHLIRQEVHQPEGGDGEEDAAAELPRAVTELAP